MRVNITKPGGAQLFYEVDEEDTVQTLCERIRDEEGIPACMQQFYIDGRDDVLDRSESLALLERKDDALDLKVMFDLDGGGARCESKSPECKIELMCCYMGCNGKFNHCSCCCCKGACTIL